MGLKKITSDDLENTILNPLENYLSSFKSEYTKERYTRILKGYMMNTLSDLIDGETFEEKVVSLVNKARKDPQWVLNLMVTISKKLRTRTKKDLTDKEYLNPNSIRNDFKPFKKLFEMNDVPMAWKRVYAMIPEQIPTSVTGSRPYTRAEINHMLKFTSNSMDRSIILVASSSGIRAGAFDFTWKDIVPIYKVDDELLLEITESQQKKAEPVCAIITIKEKSYPDVPAFITPEAYQALMDWKKEYAIQLRREPKDDEPVFKKEGWIGIRKAPRSTITQRVVRCLRRAGMANKLPKGKRRRVVPQMNGFRYFFNKAVKESLKGESQLAQLIKAEYMMDHSGIGKFDRNYFKSGIIELVKEYLNAVPALTISDDERSKAEIRKLQKEKSELEQKNEEISTMKDEIEKVKQRMDVSDKYKKKD